MRPAVGIAQNSFNLLTSIKDNGFAPLSITMEHARVAGFLPARHRDPFDRMLAAQSSVERIPLLSADPAFRELGVSPLW
jgi:PIN domain nuclease of toxin-antitoxin system